VRIKVAAALLVVTANVHAQNADAAAGALFERGLSEMEAGRLDAACPKIAESFHLDPRPGTLFTLAECESRAGKIASAYVHYADYAARFAKMNAAERLKQKERPSIAERQLKALRASIPELTIEVRGSLPEGAVVRRDGVVLGAASLGTPLPLDPGQHEVTIVLTDGKVARETLVLKVSERRQLLIAPPVPELRATEAKRTELGSATTQGGPVEAPEAHAPSHGHAGFTIATGIVAAGALAFGSVAGLLAMGKKSTIEANCVAVVCNREGKDAADSARSLGAMSTIGFVAGGVAALATLVLFVTEPRGPTLRVGWGRVNAEIAW
jgi:hypothetical protein